MGAARKWVLLANYGDQSNLRSALAYDLAALGQTEWTVRYRYADLYLNGEYAGLYMITDHVETGGGRLDVGEGTVGETAGFLCKNEPNYRKEILRSPFATERGRMTGIISPDSPTAAEEETIRAETQKMEDAIWRLDGTDEWDDTLDLDSWVRKYLLDEITENIDADLASSYFYCRREDGTSVFYGGPAWDYDMTFGSGERRNANPRTFTANTEYESTIWPTPYYYRLYRNGAFYRRVTQLYREEYLPALQALLDGGIGRLAREIGAASRMNRVRWYGENTSPGTEKIREWLEERVSFLNEVWLEGAVYYTVQVEPGYREPLLTWSLRPGERLTDLDDPLVPDPGSQIWTDRETGEVVELSRPADRDMVLITKRD